MSSPLTNIQKRTLANLARRACGLLAAQARGRGSEPDWQSEEEFRHREVAKATGKAGLRCCTQSDYSAVKGHFLELLGQHGAAFNANVRAATEERRTVEYKINSACQEFGLHISYADKICRAQNHGKGLFEIENSDEGVKRLWNLYFTIRNRGRSKVQGPKANVQSQKQGALV